MLLRPTDPGIVGAVPGRGQSAFDLIADPSHLSAEAIAPVFAAAPRRVALVTDALAAAGRPDGHHRLGRGEFDVAGYRLAASR